MKLKWFKVVLWICNFSLLCSAAHVEGIWNPKDQRVLVVTKFGYQQTNPKNERDSRGYLYGHITPEGSFNYSDPVLLVLASSTNIQSFRTNSEYGLSCGSMLQNISREGYESRCFPNGTSDFFRWIPCPDGHLCKDEDNSANVIPSYQMTMQIQEPYYPEFWYIVLLACNLDESCDWQDTAPDIQIKYDLWLTNGKPNSEEASFFIFNFSFDEQNTIQIFIITVALYSILSTVLTRADFKHREAPPRIRLLSWIVTINLIGYSLQCLNVLLYAYDGQGIFVARIAGEVLRNESVQLQCLLLLLLARGWDITYSGTSFTQGCTVIWGILAGLDLVFFFCNFTFVYDVLHDVDVFSAWPGHGMIAIRIIYAMWFLFEIRRLIDREQSEGKAVFLANFGAGFLVWFISLPMIGIVATFVSQLWRFSLILALTTFSNYFALVCLVHQFWPTSSYRKFFADYMNGHRRLGREDSHELDEYEMLFYDESFSDNDYPENDPAISHQAI